MNKKNYNTAPLPFMGQKRAFVKEFKRVLASYPDDVTIIDMFGGSGLLSHVAKSEKPNATVVYNDFDDYSFRLRNVDSTNQLLNDIRAILVDYPRKQLINKELKDKILSRIEIEDNAGYVDYITLSGSLLFSMKYELSLSGFKKQTLYNKVRISDYCADGYLSGVNVVRKDYKELFAEYSGKKNVLYLIDPPYLSTEVGTYNMNWQLKDYLDVLNVFGVCWIFDGRNNFIKRYNLYISCERIEFYFYRC